MMLRAAAWLAGLTAAALSVLLLWPAAERAQFAGVLSTRRADGLGARALYEVLSRTQPHVSRANTPLDQPQTDGTLMLLEPARPRAPLPGVKAPPAFSEAEVQAIRTFVEQGGRAVLAARHSTPLHDAFGVAVRAPAPTRERGDVELAARPAANDVTRANRVLAYVPSLLDLPATDPRALFVFNGYAAIARVAHGRGDAVFITASSLASNAYLGQRDNLLLMADLAARGPVRFDESKHGELRSEGLAALLHRFDAGSTAFQLVFAAALLVWSDARRRRARAATPPVVGARKQLEAIASLYERGRVGAHAAHTLVQALVRIGAARFGAPHARDLAELAEHLSRRGHDALSAQTRDLHERAATLSPRPKPRELLAFARLSAALQARFEAKTTATTSPSQTQHE